jgi:16S rRNA (cytosine967-C5)-methyltransferase
MVLPEEIAAYILAETVRRRASMRSIAVEFFSRNPELDYMKPIVRVLTLGVARNYILLDYILKSLGYGPPNNSRQWMLARVLVYEAVKGKLKPSRARKLADKARVKAEDMLMLKGVNPLDYVKKLQGVDRLSVLYSFPRWMIEELMEARIPDLPKLLAALNTDPTRWIRVKTGVNINTLAAELREEGVVIEPDKDLPDVARVVEGASKLTSTRAYQQGLYVVQDKASALVGWVARSEGGIAIDPTAGAAVKASHLAWLGARYVVAGDVKPQRLSEARRTVNRLKLGHLMDLAVGDARAPYWRSASVVIVDPPCTDIGRLQYEPEVKMWLTRGDLHYFRRLQLAMLSAAIEAAPRGTVIVYSVCTLTRSETVWVVRRALERNPDAEIVEPEPVIGERPPQLPKAQRMLPHVHNTQGFFIAKIVKM